MKTALLFQSVIEEESVNNNTKTSQETKLIIFTFNDELIKSLSLFPIFSFQLC